jgi:hypothetical protein
MKFLPGAACLHSCGREDWHLHLVSCAWCCGLWCVFCNNQCAEGWLRNPRAGGKNKRLEIHWHFAKEKVENGSIVTEWIDTGRQLADVFTKPLSGSKMAQLRIWLALKER